MSAGRGDVRAGLRLAVTTFTVLPLPARPADAGPDRRAAGVAMSLGPLLGLALGALLGTVLIGLTALGAPALIAATVTVALGALLTRGLHLDGLADTVDALGSYRRGAAALEIMKKPDLGPFGACALVLTLLAQVAGYAALSTRSWPQVVAAVALVTATGRAAATWACRAGVPAASPSGLGALVAGSVGPYGLIGGSIVLFGPAALAVPGRPWQGPLAAAGALALTEMVRRHTTRRFGGITGDVLGATIEIATTITLIVVLLR